MPPPPQSHNWSFGAFAEIIDNAKDAGASKCAIGVSVVAFPIGSAGQTNYKRAITMADDGTGLSM